MSYRNPQQNVDTQSGQHIRNMQQSLATASTQYFTALDKEYDNRVKLNKEITKDADERSNQAAASMYQQESANGTINFDGYKDQISRLNAIIKTSPEKEVKKIETLLLI